MEGAGINVREVRQLLGYPTTGGLHMWQWNQVARHMADLHLGGHQIIWAYMPQAIQERIALLIQDGLAYPLRPGTGLMSEKNKAKLRRTQAMRSGGVLPNASRRNYYEPAMQQYSRDDLWRAQRELHFESDDDEEDS